MRHITAILLATLLAACGNVDNAESNPPPVAPPLAAPDAKVTFIAYDKDGKQLTQTINGDVYNRMVQDRHQKALAYHRGEEIVQQKYISYIGNAGPGCHYTGNPCPLTIEELCWRNDATWVYTETNGWSSYTGNVIIGCFAGNIGYGPDFFSTDMPWFWDPNISNYTSWRHAIKSIYTGENKIGIWSHADYVQWEPGPNSPRYQQNPWTQVNYFNTFAHPSGYVKSIKHF